MVKKATPSSAKKTASSPKSTAVKATSKVNSKKIASATPSKKSSNLKAPKKKTAAPATKAIKARQVAAKASPSQKTPKITKTKTVTAKKNTPVKPAKSKALAIKKSAPLKAAKAKAKTSIATKKIATKASSKTAVKPKVTSATKLKKASAKKAVKSPTRPLKTKGPASAHPVKRQQASVKTSKKSSPKASKAQASSKLASPSLKKAQVATSYKPQAAKASVASAKKTSSFKQDYSELKEHLHQARLIESIGNALMWDAETHMPSEGIDFRSEQKAIISEQAHEAHTSQAYKEKLQNLINLETGALVYKNTAPASADALKVLRDDYVKQSKLPTAFVKQMALVTSKAIHVWAKARAENSFSAFLPHLSQIVELCRQKADYIGYKDHPYDALVDEYEPGMTSQKLSGLFSKLQSELTPFIQNLPNISQDCLKGYYPREKQRTMGREMLRLVGLQESFCRLDESAHPFCMALNPKDVRLTTKYHEDRVMSSVGSVLHEAGHGLYEHNLPVEEFGTPLGQACSLAIHESQSRLFEVFAGKSRPFWNYLYPRLQSTFSETLGGVSLDQFYRAIHHASPSLIRIESDEVTYNLHIIVRFECERGLIEGSLKPKDLPEMWNEKMKQYLGVVPTSFANGCMQDIHWSMGAIGYFPTYTLGNLAAASLFATYQKEHPEWVESFEKGDLSSLGTFVKERIHRHGRRYSSQELLKKATGSDFGVSDLMNYLKAKYASL